MANTIITKNSSTASAVPAAGSLTQGELAVNVTDKKLYTKNSGGSVVEITPTAIQGTTTAAIPTSALASGTADSSKVLLGDRTWGTLSGGVTSLNGQTGAITDTTAYAIGQVIVGRPKNVTNYAVNATVAGSSLWNSCCGSYYSGGNGFTAGYGSGNILNGPTLVNTGSWRCVSTAGQQDSGWGLSGIWVRYA